MKRASSVAISTVLRKVVVCALVCAAGAVLSATTHPNAVGNAAKSCGGS